MILALNRSQVEYRAVIGHCHIAHGPPDYIGGAVSRAIRVTVGVIAADSTGVKVHGCVTRTKSVVEDCVSPAAADEHAYLTVFKRVVEDGEA